MALFFDSNIANFAFCWAMALHPQLPPNEFLMVFWVSLLLVPSRYNFFYLLPGPSSSFNVVPARSALVLVREWNLISNLDKFLIQWPFALVQKMYFFNSSSPKTTKNTLHIFWDLATIQYTYSPEEFSWFQFHRSQLQLISQNPDYLPKKIYVK